MLLYRIEFPGAPLVTVRLQEQGSRRILYLDTLQQLAKPEDREGLALIVKAHLRAQNSRSTDTITFQQISLTFDQAREILPLLAKTNRLLKDGRVLAFDVFRPAKLYWRAEEHSKVACTARAVLQYKDREIALEMCEGVFPGWALFEDSFFLYTSSIPWKWIELFIKGATLLEGMQKKRFLEEEPPVLWKEKPAERALEVFPELKLTDATGCFANLWMNYPGLGAIALDDLAPSIGGATRLSRAELAWETDLLEAGYARKQVGQSQYYCAGDRVVDTLRFLLELGWNVTDVRGRKICKQTSVAWQVSERSHQLVLSGRVIFQDKEVALTSALKARGIWLEIDRSSVGLLDKSAFSFLPEGECEEDVFVIRKNSIGALMPLIESAAVSWDAPLKHLIEGLKQGARLEYSPPHPSFRAQLLPYQQKGVDWLAFLHRWGFSGLLADEMGLGKTVQVLAFFSRFEKKMPRLIVAPSSLLFHWRSEIERFIPGASVYVHSGIDRSRIEAEILEYEWVITSYAVLRSDRALLSQIEFAAIALDEANAIKTATTQTAQAACRLKAPFKVAITGTPLENRIEELGSQFRFLMPSLLEERFELKGQPVASSCPFNGKPLEEVRRKVRPFILRRCKQEVEIDLPEKMEQIAWIEMGDAQKRLYEERLQSVRSNLLKSIEKEGLALHRMELLEAILRLRQICCDPRLIGSEIRGTKIEHLLEDLEGRKVLVYSQFTSMLQLIGKELNANGKSYLYLDGSTPPEARQKLVEQFQEDEKTTLFLLSLKAGGVGLNLTAADYVLLFDPWWNEALMAQAIDRVHRIGQTKKVIAKRYLVPHSIEEKMLKISQEKKGLCEQLLGGEGVNWTEEDWFRLLS